MRYFQIAISTYAKEAHVGNKHCSRTLSFPTGASGAPGGMLDFEAPHLRIPHAVYPDLGVHGLFAPPKRVRTAAHPHHAPYCRLREPNAVWPSMPTKRRIRTYVNGQAARRLAALTRSNRGLMTTLFIL